MKKLRESGGGFTLVEVVIFLAISAMLIFSAMLSVQGRTSAIQYTDATRAVESFLDRRIAQVLRGSVVAENRECRWNGNTSYAWGAGVSDGSCIFLGYMFRLDSSRPGEIDVIQMYGGRLPSDDQCFIDNPEDPLQCVFPVPVGDTLTAVETFQIPWGMIVTQASQNTDNTRLFGYLRDPTGQTLIPVSFRVNTEDDIDNQNAYREVHATSEIDEEFEVEICMFGSNQRNSAITLGSDAFQYSLNVVFDDSQACPDTVVTGP